MAAVADVGWVVVVPVKPLAAAKRRLRGAVPAARHPDLVLAMLRDTIAAAGAVAEVVVVTADPEAAAAATDVGAAVAPDPGRGLNPALGYAAERWIGTHRDRAALAGDLPALDPASLAGALAAAGARGFVPDAAGTGTVLLAARTGVPLRPCFGGRSAAAHLASGAALVPGAWPGLRRDVDTPADLRAALALGAAPHTRALLADLGPAARRTRTLVADVGPERAARAGTGAGPAV
jgi:2-phospho-L-lactate/phosphoenolpyruvate guanylyltransferase